MVRVIRDTEQQIIKVDTTDAKVSGNFGNSILYEYGNYNFHPRAYEVLSNSSELKYRNDDIILTMFPKSGSTWLSECIYLIVTGYQYHEASQLSIEFRFPQIDSPSHDVIDLIKDGYDNKTKTRMIKSSIPPNLLIPNENNVEKVNGLHGSKPRVISIFRNPRDILVSFYHHCKTVTHYDVDFDFDKFFELFVSGKIPCGPVWQLFNDSFQYYLDNLDTTMIIYYEDMKNDLRHEISRICKFLRKEEPKNELEWNKFLDHLSVEKMKKNATINREDWVKLGLKNEKGFDFVRKGQVNDWKNYFSEDQLKTFESLVISKLIPVLASLYSQQN